MQLISFVGKRDELEKNSVVEISGTIGNCNLFLENK